MTLQVLPGVTLVAAKLQVVELKITKVNKMKAAESDAIKGAFALFMSEIL